jgi:hypothetical protein
MMWKTIGSPLAMTGSTSNGAARGAGLAVVDLCEQCHISTSMKGFLHSHIPFPCSQSLQRMERWPACLKRDSERHS